MAATTKWTQERGGRVLEAIGVGATYELAAAFAGVSEDTLSRWRKGRSGAPAEFAEHVRLAEGRASIGWLAKIEREANNGDWRAAAWKLERRYPQDYGKTVQELQGKDGGSIKVEFPERPDGPK